MKHALSILLLCRLLAPIQVAHAEEAPPSNTDEVEPYINKIRQKIADEDAKKGGISQPTEGSQSVEPFIDSIREKLKEKEIPRGTVENPDPYINSLRAQDPGRFDPDNKKAQGYSDRLRPTIPPKEDGGAIQAVNEGHSELKLKRPGKIHDAFGFKVGTAYTRDVTAAPGFSKETFKNVYNNPGFAPDLTIFFEHQLFHSEYLGSLGLIVSAGFSFYKGTGVFNQNLAGGQPQLIMPDGTTLFDSHGRTKFTFVDVPVSIGANYRFNLTHYIRPFAQVAPTIVGFSETRNDGLDGHKGKSIGVQASAGASILLDWLNRESTWNLYDDYSVKHYYLTLEYSRLMTPTSNIDFAFNGFDAGFTFEF